MPCGASGKEITSPCRRHKRRGFDLWVGKILGRRKWQPTPLFLPGEFKGQRSLAGNSPWGCKELNGTGRWGRNINNLRYADDTTLREESEEEVKSLLMKVKEENEKLA